MLVINFDNHSIYVSEHTCYVVIMLHLFICSSHNVLDASSHYFTVSQLFSIWQMHNFIL